MTDDTVIPAAPPTKPPPAGDACGVCFFSTVDAIGITHCCYYPPAWQRSVLPGVGPPGAPPPSPGGANYAGVISNWPVVDPTNWCGHGYNTTTSAWMTPDGKAPTA